METVRSEPVCIVTNTVGEIFTEQCSLDNRVGEWQELEHFWDEEKQRLQDVDGQSKPVSNSLEDHLMYGDFIAEPKLKKETIDQEYIHTVRGDEIKDIPTSYTIAGFKSHELVVIGTYVDRDIVPGFQYRVRKNHSNEYLFKGRAVYLESVGLGYGKRITFQGDTLNDNDNYFWSDTHNQGYGFTLQTINQGSVFTIVEPITRKEIGRVVVKGTSLTEDVELSSTVAPNSGRIEKKVKVHFSSDVVFTDINSGSNVFIEEVEVRGVVLVVREDAYARAKVEQIMLDNFVTGDCQLVSEEYVA